MPLLDDAPRFLTYEELRDEIVRYTYRPGWELTVFMDPWEGPCLYVVAMVPNAYRADGDLVELRIRSNIPPIPDAAYFSIWLTWRLMLIESHEAREFFRRADTNRPVFDPHDPVEPGGHAHRKDAA